MTEQAGEVDNEAALGEAYAQGFSDALDGLREHVTEAVDAAIHDWLANLGKGDPS